ncbi:nickel-binding protein [Kocuria arenosa]|uniref:nickel-binding protein n=1 Tax=Kocuria arenosa TaxID=3071446 RepID=UPI0034D63811
MSLHLLEIVPASASKDAVTQLIATVSEAVSAAGAEFIESQVTADHGRVFVIVEADSAEDLAQTARTAAGDAAAEVTGPDAVRLVGAELDDIKKLKGDAQFLVEWDIPAEITMEQYLARKEANSPKYAEVPEVSFLRTYVREDTAKCLCFYNAPDEASVERARQAVGTPFDRLFKLNV